MIIFLGRTLPCSFSKVVGESLEGRYICNYLYCILSMNVYMVCSCTHIYYIDVHENSVYVYIYIYIIISHLWCYTLYWDRPNSSLLVWLDLDTPQWFGHYSLVYIYSVYKRLHLYRNGKMLPKISKLTCIQVILVFKSTCNACLPYWILYFTFPSSTPQGCKFLKNGWWLWDFLPGA